MYYQCQVSLSLPLHFHPSWDSLSCWEGVGGEVQAVFEEGGTFTVKYGLCNGSFCTFLRTFENNACCHSSVTLESWRTGVRVKHAMNTQKRFKNSLLCTLPALDQRGPLPAAVVSGHCPDHSRADRTPPPAIYGAFLPSPCSAATGGSGCQWCPASAEPGGSPPATDYWGGSVSGWTHPWWRNNYIRKTIVILMKVL